jgi:hypothetical protein
MENEKSKYELHPHNKVDYSYVQDNLKKSIDRSMEEYQHIMDQKDTHRLVRKTDSIVDGVVDSFISRANFGKKKYNNDMDRTDLSVDEWLQHAIEEHMDAILYLNKLRKELNGKV